MNISHCTIVFITLCVLSDSIRLFSAKRKGCVCSPLRVRTTQSTLAQLRVEIVTLVDARVAASASASNTLDTIYHLVAVLSASSGIPDDLVGFLELLKEQAGSATMFMLPAVRWGSIVNEVRYSLDSVRILETIRNVKRDALVATLMSLQTLEKDVDGIVRLIALHERRLSRQLFIQGNNTDVPLDIRFSLALFQMTICASLNTPLTRLGTFRADKRVHEFVQETLDGFDIRLEWYATKFLPIKLKRLFSLGLNAKQVECLAIYALVATRAARAVQRVMSVNKSLWKSLNGVSGDDSLCERHCLLSRSF